jgi:hypothetical protein
MRTIKTLPGTPIELDGDALAVIETISRDLTRRHELAYGFEDVDREIQHVIDQMQEADLRVYLKESLFMSFNRYENDRMLTIVKRASQATADKAEGRGQKAKGRLQGREQRTGGNGRSGKARSKAKGRTARGNKRRRRA